MIHGALVKLETQGSIHTKASLFLPSFNLHQKKGLVV
jgi:hypothetical protein